MFLICIVIFLPTVQVLRDLVTVFYKQKVFLFDLLLLTSVFAKKNNFL